MATVYKTADGTVFENETEARQYQAKLDAKSAKDLADTKSGQARLFENFNAMIKFFNEGNWEKVVYYGGGIDDKQYSYSVYKWVLPDKEREQASQMLNRAKSELKKLGIDPSTRKGKIIYKKGDYHGEGVVYEGDIVNGVPHGKGKMIYTNGKIYEGDFVNDREKGKCKVTFPNGDIFEGEYDVTPGVGKYIYKNGDIWEGKAFSGGPHGKGKMRYADGSIYEGEMEDGKKQGKGTMTYPDGRVEKGKWKDDKFKGKGLFG